MVLFAAETGLQLGKLLRGFRLGAFPALQQSLDEVACRFLVVVPGIVAQARSFGIVEDQPAGTEKGRGGQRVFVPWLPLAAEGIILLAACSSNGPGTSRPYPGHGPVVPRVLGDFRVRPSPPGGKSVAAFGTSPEAGTSGRSVPPLPQSRLLAQAMPPPASGARPGTM